MTTIENTPIAPASEVVQLLNEMGEIEQLQHELAIKTRQTKAKLYEAKNKLDKSAVTQLKKDNHAKLMRVRYTTNNGLTIHNLRQAGNTVSVSHIRYAKVPGVAVDVPVPSFLRGAFDFCARGGSTHITIIKPNGEWTCLSSVCHSDDSFDYKMGVKTALEQLTQEEAKTFLAEDKANPVDL